MADTARAVPPEQTSATPAAESPRFDAHRLTLDELRTPRPQREFVIEPLILRGAVVEMSGAHGISKSTLALDMCLHICTGFHFADLRTPPGFAVFASREDSRDEILRRVQAWLAPLDSDQRAKCEQDFVERLTLLGREETQGLKLTAKLYGQAHVDPLAIDAVAESCFGASLIVLETASRLSGGDELNEDLAVLADALERIAAETGAAVMIIRHVSKAAARQKETDSYAGRGGGALSDAARSVLTLVQLSAEQAAEHGITLDDEARSSAIMLTHAKSSYCAPARPLFFVRRPGPVLELVRARSINDVHEERLLAYLRERHAQGERLSLRQITSDAKLHLVPTRQIPATLHRLATSGLVRADRTKKSGVNCTVWLPIDEGGATGATE